MAVSVEAGWHWTFDESAEDRSMAIGVAKLGTGILTVSANEKSVIHPG